MKRRILALVALAAVWTPLASTGVAIADDARSVAISEVDARTSDVSVHVDVDDPSNKESYNFELSENGAQQSVGLPVNVIDRLNTGRIVRRTVVVIDTSRTTAREDAIVQEKIAAKQFVDGLLLSGNDSVSIVGAGSHLRRSGNFSHKQAEMDAFIDDLPLTSGRAINRAVNFGLTALSDVEGDVKNIVIFSSGAGTDIDVPLTELQRKIEATNVNVYVGGFAIKGATDPSPLKQLIVQNRGAYRSVTETAEIAGLGAQVAKAANNQWVLNYKSSTEGVLRVKVKVDGKSALGNTNSGINSTGSDLRTEFSKAPAWIKRVPLPSPGIARIVISLLALGCVGLFIWVVFTIVDRRGSLEAALKPYDDAKIDPDDESELHLETALLRRALAVTEDIARERGFLVKVEEKLYQADLSINAAEFMFLAAAITILTTVAAFALEGIVVAILALIAAIIGLPAFLNLKASRRKRAFERQLPDALQLLAGTLKAGYSLTQGLDATAQQVDDPLGKELRQAMAEAQLGRPVEEALNDVADRMQSPDFKWTVMAIKIQREVGGNLSEVLRNVAQTMIDRERLRREVNALTAEGRLSAIILVLMPPGMAFYMWITNPEYLSPLFSDSLGRLLVGMGSIMMLGGIVWLKKMLKLEL